MVKTITANNPMKNALSEPADLKIQAMAKQYGRPVHQKIPDNVRPITKPAVWAAIQQFPYMVPTDDGALYNAQFDQNNFQRIRNLIGNDLRMEFCTNYAIQQLINREGTGAQQSQRAEGGEAELISIFRFCLAEQVSDLHIIARESGVQFKKRVHGSLYPLLLTRVYTLAAIKNICGAAMNYITHETGGSNKDVFKASEPQGTTFKLIVDRKKVEVRYEHTPAVEGIDVVMRILAGDQSGAVDIHSLGYPPDQLQLLQRSNNLPFGIILCCGETGSGKTTLIAGLLSMQPGTKKIYSFEDPPEIKLGNVTQVPVNTKSDVMNWESLAQNVLRMDPDVIFYGEIRSAAVAESGIKAASTGHLVFSTLHTNTAVGAVQRLVDLGVERAKLAMPGILKVLIAQKLIKVLCKHCATPLEDSGCSKAEIERLHRHFGEDFQHLRCLGPGCSACDNRGISGRHVIAELIYIDDRGREFIRSGDIDGWLLYLKRMGWRSMQDRADEFVVKGLLDPFEVEKKLDIFYGVDVSEFSYDNVPGAEEI